MSRELRCTAGHVVGIPQCGDYTGLVLLVSAKGRRGREYLVRLAGIVAIRCDCGAGWTPDAAGLPLEGLEHKAPSLVGRG